MMGIVASKRAFLVSVHLLRPLHFNLNASSRLSFSSLSTIDRICSLLNDNKNETAVTSNATLEDLSKRLSLEYEHLPPLESSTKGEQIRGAIMELLATELGSQHDAILDAAQNYTNLATDTDLPLQRAQLANKLLEACTPQYNLIFRMILAENAQVGIRFFVRLRQDLLHYMKVSQWGTTDTRMAQLKQLDAALSSLLATWFSSEALEIRRITYETTSAAIIEVIATKEAVHPLRSLDDLRTRLGPDKRVFCAFHPLLPNEPLVFVHVALRREVPDSMDQVMGTDVLLAGPPTVATFYSISSTQPGLSGVDLGHILIKKATILLQQELPSLEVFVTLSPLPRFRSWIRDKLLDLNRGGTFVDSDFLSGQDLDMLRSALKCGVHDDVTARFLKKLEDPWTLMSFRSVAFEPILMKLAARYLIQEKHRRKPLDGVARFHIQNGAELYRLNYMADLSRKGIHTSLGLMVNYRYDLDHVEENRKQHAANSTIPVQDDVAKWLQ